MEGSYRKRERERVRRRRRGCEGVTERERGLGMRKKRWQRLGRM